MIPNLFLLTNLILVAASFFALRLPEVHRKFSLAILQAILFLPLLAVEYLAVVLNFIPDPEGIRFSQFGPIYFASLICLLVMLFMAWQLEAFWRQLPKSRRREYGLFVVGSALVLACCGCGWRLSGGMWPFLSFWRNCCPGSAGSCPALTLPLTAPKKSRCARIRSSREP